MKLLLLLLFPMSAFSQVQNITVGGYLTNTTTDTWNVTCTRTHIDTIKNVEWYVEVRADTGFLSIPISIGGSRGLKFTFVHTHNDLSKEDHWYDVHNDKGSWTYYIHEVRIVALKPKGQPIIYPNR